MTSILFISPTDFIYQPRIYKAANYLNEKGYKVFIYTPITLKLTKSLIEDYSNRGIKFIYTSFLKNEPNGYINWLYVSLIHKIIKKLKIYFDLEVLPEYYLNKYLIKTSKIFKRKFSIVSINNVDMLPLACRLKQFENDIILIYDAQEYFKGQYSQLIKSEFEWVIRNEQKFINNCDTIITTTDVLRSRLVEEYQLTKPTFRVRNTPSLTEMPKEFKPKYPGKIINAIWAGVTINYMSERGIHIILDSFKYVNPNLKLYLQGNVKDDQRELINHFISTNNLSDNVKILPPSRPDRYLESLIKYDIGISGELGEDDNQKLTSSNKLFYYIAAGLAVVAPNLPGTQETFQKHDIGLIYSQGNSKDLADKLNELALDTAHLYKLKLNAHNAFKKELNWENDYNQVNEYLINNLI